MKIEKISIDKLLLDPANARKHGKKNLDSIKGSLAKFGQQKPIVVNADNVIVAGNGTLQAAKELGWKEIDIVRTNLKGSDITAFGIADNRTSELAEWDDDVLKELLEGLKAEDFDLSAIGFDDDEFAELMGGKSKEGLTDPDAVPEVPEEPKTKLGDIYRLGNHRLMCGDSTSIDAVEKLMDGQKAQFCFTSPPYNSAAKFESVHSKAKKSGGKGFYADGYSDDRTSDEYIQFNADIISTMKAVAADDFTCCYNINYNKNSPSEYIDVVHAAKQTLPLVETIVWEKALAVSLQGDNLTRIYEFVFVLCKGKFKINKSRTECLRNLWKISNIGANHESHKACFPLALVEEGIKNFCPHGGVIIEPFGGTGTTAIAAEKLGCKSHVMELDPKYCDVIIKRWEDFTGKKAELLSA